MLELEGGVVAVASVILSHESVKNEPLNFASNRGAKSFINEFLHLTNQDYNQEMLMGHIIYLYISTELNIVLYNILITYYQSHRYLTE